MSHPSWSTKHCKAILKHAFSKVKADWLSEQSNQKKKNLIEAKNDINHIEL